MLIYTPTINGSELFHSAYAYAPVSEGNDNRRSDLPKHYNYRDVNDGLINGYTYTYDATGNIATEENAATVTQVWAYMGELIFNMLVLVGSVKMSDRIIREMMGL